MLTTNQTTLNSVLDAINAKELKRIKKEFGLTEKEITYLLGLSLRYRQNSNSILKKLILK
ncbi:hypothetical protein GH721_17015 [Kriegella sp. EG-1]|nr:hypothetical protein [Flavobacteriaceae bacterium EG-1]